MRRVKALRASPKRKRETEDEAEEGVDSTGNGIVVAGEETVNGEGGAVKAKRNTRRKNKERKVL